MQLLFIYLFFHFFIYNRPKYIISLCNHQVQDEDATPEWVSQLINSGLLYEVHKFSKFIHGCSVLLREDVRAAPYWIDDPSLKKSIVDSGAADVLIYNEGANKVSHSYFIFALLVTLYSFYDIILYISTL
jgi:hypothetical protein